MPKNLLLTMAMLATACVIPAPAPQYSPPPPAHYGHGPGGYDHGPPPPPPEPKAQPSARSGGTHARQPAARNEDGWTVTEYDPDAKGRDGPLEFGVIAGTYRLRPADRRGPRGWAKLVCPWCGTRFEGGGHFREELPCMSCFRTAVFPGPEN